MKQLMTNEIIQFNVGGVATKINQVLDNWENEKDVSRLWASDPKLWTNHDENKWTGWFNVMQSELAETKHISVLAQELKTAGYKHIVVLGMGGSSLCPAMMAETFGDVSDFPHLHILDSTDPLQIMHLEQRLDLKHTFFIVSSKSGSTLEPNIFKQYFYARLQQVLGKEDVGHCFLAITDPGSKVETIAKQSHFKTVFHGIPSIGGRYSALSNFGMVPTGLMGIDVKNILDSATLMAEACAADIKVKNNPGAILGVVLGVCAKQGKDKLTFIVSPEIQALGAWLEQLIAESTGKEGKGLIPVDLEALGTPDVYAKDRIFAYIRLDTAADPEQDLAVQALETAGHAVVRCHMQDKNHLGATLFQWEFATAVAGSILGINPFNQPDVEASKVRTIALTSEYEKTGRLVAPKAFYSTNKVELYTDEMNAVELKQRLKGKSSIEAYLQAHLSRVQPNDYIDISAFIEMSDENTELLQQCRILLRDAKKVATCLGFGPRFLHSTGQLYKGGPNSGVFLQITADHQVDIPIPQEKYTFGVVIDAQAQGDFEVLTQRSRRALRIHLKGDVQTGLKELHQTIHKILQH